MNSEITVMSSGSAEPALDHVAAAFQKETGRKVNITYNEDVRVFDVMIASRDALARKFRPAGVVEEGGVSIGWMGIGITVRPDAPLPEVSTVEALKRSALEAESMLVSTHTSGLYIEEMFKKLGIYAQIEAKLARYRNGPELMDRLLNGKGREFAFLSINQIRRDKDKGLKLVGPLPEGVQLSREFVAVPATQCADKDVARAFVSYCGGPGKAVFIDHGFTAT